MEINLKKFTNPTGQQWAALIAEFTGTFLFTLVLGLTTIRFAESNYSINELAVAFLPFLAGIAYALMAYVFRQYSAGHLNPAVSLAAFLSGTISIIKFAAFVVVQLLGAIAAIFVMKSIYTADLFAHLQSSEFVASLSEAGIGLAQIAVFEALATVFLVFPVLVMLRKRISTNVGPLLAGMGLTMGMTVVQPLSGGFVNTAIAVAMGFPVVYWIAPLLGAVIATIPMILIDNLYHGSLDNRQQTTDNRQQIKD